MVIFLTVIQFVIAKKLLIVGHNTSTKLKLNDQHDNGSGKHIPSNSKTPISSNKDNKTALDSANTITSIRVTGVSFQNEDGSSRQDAISLLKSGDHVFVSLNPSELFPDRISVYSSLRCIGSLPSDIAKKLSTMKFEESLAVVHDVGKASNGLYGLSINLTNNRKNPDAFYYFKYTVKNNIYKENYISLNFTKIRSYSIYRTLDSCPSNREKFEKIEPGQAVVIRPNRLSGNSKNVSVFCQENEISFLSEYLSDILSYLYYEFAVGSIFDIGELESGRIDYRINFKIDLNLKNNNLTFENYFEDDNYITIPVILFFVIHDIIKVNEKISSRFIFMHKTLGAIKMTNFPEPSEHNPAHLDQKIFSQKKFRYVEGVVLSDNRTCRLSFDSSFFEKFFTYVAINESEFQKIRQSIERIDFTPLILNYFDMRGDGTRHTFLTRDIFYIKKSIEELEGNFECYDIFDTPYNLGYEYYDSKDSWYACMEPDYDINDQ